MLRGGSRTAATSKRELFLIIVNCFQPLTIIIKRSILDVATVLDPPLMLVNNEQYPLVLRLATLSKNTGVFQ